MAAEPTLVDHGRDADAIAGDNANIHRIVDQRRRFVSFAYDNAVRRAARRARRRLLDYTPGGPDFRPDLFGAHCRSAAARTSAAPTRSTASRGDDCVYGGCGNDRLFGDGEDDDLIGGWGNDWISGGTGQDGVLGDDGRIFTSRNGTARAAVRRRWRPTQTTRCHRRATTRRAIINPTGALKKSVDLTPFNLKPNAAGGDDPLFDPNVADDIIFGGLGDDFLHGGAGDDAISGAEALGEAYASATTRRGDLVGVVRSDFSAAVQPGQRAALRHDVDLERRSRPRRASSRSTTSSTRAAAILLSTNGQRLKTGSRQRQFLLNCDRRPTAAHGAARATARVCYSDGDDVIFGDLGNDWLVGGTGSDTMWGGLGNDLLNADDDHRRASGGLNDRPDTHPSYEDRAFGGAGLDVLIANTGGDRLIDWVGEFNTYIVPFSPFGMSTVSRQLAPGPEASSSTRCPRPRAPTRRVPPRPARTRRATASPRARSAPSCRRTRPGSDQTGGPRDPQAGTSTAASATCCAPPTSTTARCRRSLPDSGTLDGHGGALQVIRAERVGATRSRSTTTTSTCRSTTRSRRRSRPRSRPAAGRPTPTSSSTTSRRPTSSSPGINVSTNKYEMGHRDASRLARRTRRRNVQVKAGHLLHAARRRQRHRGDACRSTAPPRSSTSSRPRMVDGEAVAAQQGPDRRRLAQRARHVRQRRGPGRCRRR